MKTIRTKGSLVTALLFCLAAGFQTGCRKDLCPNHYPQASVALSYEQAWERDYGMHWIDAWSADRYGAYDALRPGRPEGVSMIAYAGERSDLFFLQPEGGEVVFGSEVRSLLFYNNDTEYIVLNDLASLPAARATTTTRTRSTLRAMHADERTINPPDVLYGSFADEVPQIKLHENVPLPVRMQPLAYTYVVRYGFEYGRQHVALARGALAGMAESVYLRDGVTCDEGATILFDCALTDDGARAEVRSFGVPGFPDEYYGRERRARDERRYTLNLEVRLTNGKLKEFVFDVTEQLRRQPRGGVIEVGGIRVEDGDNMNNSGFDVDVDDWGEYTDIVLPVGPAN